MRMLFNKRCTVYRIKETLDEFNTPVGETLQKIGEFRCSVSRKSATVSKEDPNMETAETTRLYSYDRTDIQDGDIIEVEGEKFSASIPYRPRNHHLEVDLMKEGDV